jgi:hypothetical protein
MEIPEWKFLASNLLVLVGGTFVAAGRKQEGIVSGASKFGRVRCGKRVANAIRDWFCVATACYK